MSEGLGTAGGWGGFCQIHGQMIPCEMCRRFSASYPAPFGFVWVCPTCGVEARDYTDYGIQSKRQEHLNNHYRFGIREATHD